MRFPPEIPCLKIVGNHMCKLTRREFLRLATVMGGASLFAGCSFLAEEAPVPQYIKGAPGVDPVETLEGIKNIYSVCDLCPGNCGICCRVAQGTVVKIGGNPYSPISVDRPLPFDTPVAESVKHGGSICAVGGSGIETLYDPFRVARPLKRVGSRGSGKWQALSWEQALEEISEGGDLFGEGKIVGLRAIRQEREDFSFLLGRADWGSSTFIKKFLAAFPGALLLRDREVQIDGIATEAANAVFGSGTGPVDADYGNARFLVSFGDAPLDSGIPIVSVARQIAEARVGSLGLRWAVVDPRLSTSASKADLWIPIIPGTDVHLALGIMKALAERHAGALKVSRDSIEKLTAGCSLADYAAACGVSPEIPVRLAEFLVQEGGRSAVVPGRGIFSQTNGAETAKAIFSLNLAVGSLPGTGGIATQSAGYLNQAEAKLLNAATKEQPAVEMGSATKALMVWRADPVYDDPYRASVHLKDREKVPLFVAIDSQITETTVLADYILPDTTYLERWDVCSSPPSVTVPGFGVRVPVVGGFDEKTGDYFPILPETKLMEDILIRLASSIGVPGFGEQSPGGLRNAWGYYRQALPAAANSFKNEGRLGLASDDDLKKVLERGGIFGARQTGAATQSGFPQKKAHSVPSFRVTSKEQDTEAGLMLITYTLPFHRSARSGINSWLLEVLPENRLIMNPADARKLKIAQGEEIIVESIDGKRSHKCKAQPMPGIRPGVVALARGFGYRQSGATSQIINGLSATPDKTRGAGINAAGFATTPGQTIVRIRKA